MIYKYGTMSVADIIKKLLMLPNQNQQVVAITTFDESVWVSTEDKKMIVIDDEITTYEDNPEMWDDVEDVVFTDSEWENIVKEYLTVE